MTIGIVVLAILVDVNVNQEDISVISKIDFKNKTNNY